MTPGAAPGAWNPPRTILCLVTPGTTPQSASQTVEERAAAVLALAEDAIGAGVDLVQVREPDLPTRALTDIVARLVAAAQGTTTQVVVNDRVDVALACGAAGAHLGTRSLPATRVREMAPAPFLIGRSIHRVAEARVVEAQGVVDYVIAGTVFQSASKPGQQVFLGTEALAEIARTLSVPVLAIGGVDLDTVVPVAAAGARGFAAIRFFADASAGGRLREAVKRARNTFDTTRTIP